MYADDAKGVAIGFNKSYFDLLNIFKDSKIEEMYSLRKMSYGYNSIIEFLDNKCGFNNITETSSCDEFLDLHKAAFTKVCRNAAFYKNDSFKEEDEWRIAVTLKNYDYNTSYFDISSNDQYLSVPFEDRYKFKRFGFISSSVKLIPYIEMQITKLDKAISSIHIGPKSNVSQRDMKMYLIANGLLQSTEDESIKIKISKSTYR